MLKKIYYPKCFYSFIEFCNNEKYLNNKLFHKLINLRPFDVTLRDGLQGLSHEDQLLMTSIEKINLYYKIKEKYQPQNMEIGSIVSDKILPIFKNCDNFYNHIELNQNVLNEPKINNFILIPNEKQFENINKFINLSCFSFITSVSESFQMKNTNMGLDKTFDQLNNMKTKLDSNPGYNIVKLYVSCINECPIEGKIENDIIIDKILQYQKLNPNILCLSDTCGTLSSEDLNYIISNVNKNEKYDNLSLHLHVKKGRENIVEDVIHTALDLGISNFDVSELESGGCSVTINKKDLAPNLSYGLYYKSLASYISSRV